KFIATAKIKATSIPLAPPTRLPTTSRRPLRTPSRSAVFKPLGMVKLYQGNVRAWKSLHGCNLRDQAGDERDAAAEPRDVDVLVRGVRAIANRPEAIERWDADGGGEVSV